MNCDNEQGAWCLTSRAERPPFRSQANLFSGDGQLDHGLIAKIDPIDAIVATAVTRAADAKEDRLFNRSWVNADAAELRCCGCQRHLLTRVEAGSKKERDYA